RLPVAAAADHPPRRYHASAPLPAAIPRRVDIGSIGLHADLVPRGLTDGTVDPPPYSTPEVAGWYRGGPTPGATGAALIVGHVDTETGAAVFYALRTVRAGARVDITRADGTVAEFSVEAVETVQKAHFDPARVYGSTGRPELRLITCGGTFDRTAQTYSANVVVYAVLTGSHPA
ncbi:Sortase family protein, partial [Streptomyces sp. DvalAA-14]|uniref:class F sortase n=1 Tax=unclassified Streptomyces TaxID=2593676 RepID=UPI00081BBC8D